MNSDLEKINDVEDRDGIILSEILVYLNRILYLLKLYKFNSILPPSTVRLTMSI